MPPMSSNPIAYKLRCTACRKTHELSWPDIDRLVKSGRARKTDLSGSMGRDTEWFTTECDECFGFSRNRRADVPEQMAKIRRHQLEIESRGVATDEAIASAVEREMTYGEISLSHEFVARVHGLDKPSRAPGITVEPDHETEAVTRLKALPWAAPAPTEALVTQAACCEPDCPGDGSFVCEICRNAFCNRHLVLVIGLDGPNRPLCRTCRAALMEG